MNSITLERIEKQDKKFKLKPSALNFEDGLNTTFEVIISDEYARYIESLKDKVVVLRSKDDPSLAVIVRPYQTSRYSPAGQKKLAKTIRKRFIGVESGVFLTLTFDPKKTSLTSAWANLSSLIKRTMKFLKTYAQREAKSKGLKVNIQYIWVIEVQRNGYPHVHVFYPSIKRLLDVHQIQQIWGMGFVFVKKLDHVKVGEYMSKYLSKGQGLEKALPFVWFFKIRLHGASNLVVLKDDVAQKSASRYIFLGMCSLGELETFIRSNNVKVVKDVCSNEIILSLT
jgi:hypothetical protein